MGQRPWGSSVRGPILFGIWGQREFYGHLVGVPAGFLWTTRVFIQRKCEERAFFFAEIFSGCDISERRRGMPLKELGSLYVGSLSLKRSKRVEVTPGAQAKGTVRALAALRVKFVR